MTLEVTANSDGREGQDRDVARVDEDRRLISMRATVFDTKEASVFLTGTLPIFYGLDVFEPETSGSGSTHPSWRIWIELAGTIFDLQASKHEDAGISYRLSPMDTAGICERRRQILQPQVRVALEALEKLAVRAELVGSFAWGGFGLCSDIDFLVMDDRGHGRSVLEDAAKTAVVDASVDILFWASLSEEQKLRLTADRAAFLGPQRPASRQE